MTAFAPRRRAAQVLEVHAARAPITRGLDVHFRVHGMEFSDGRFQWARADGVIEVSAAHTGSVERLVTPTRAATATAAAATAAATARRSSLTRWR
jgi:hypothetical protein